MVSDERIFAGEFSLLEFERNESKWLKCLDLDTPEGRANSNDEIIRSVMEAPWIDGYEDECYIEEEIFR